MTAPEKPTRPYSSVFPRQFACTHSDELCEVTRSSNAEGRLLYPPRRRFDYGFRLRLQLIGRQLNLSKINCSASDGQNLTSTNEPRLRENTREDRDVIICVTYFDRCMRWDDFDRCVRWDALTADGIIMMASNQHFERALLRRSGCIVL